MKTLALVLFGFTVAQVAAPAAVFADVLQLTPGTGVPVEGINISSGGTALVDGRTTALTTVGAGLRTKKKLGIHFKVYVAQVLVSQPAKFERTEDGTLRSLDSMDAVALTMNMLRGVDAGTVQDSFREGLQANSVDLKRADINAFLSAVASGGDAESGKQLVIVGEKLPGGVEAVTYQDTHGKVQTIRGTDGFVKNVLSIWLGIPADSGLVKLKNALLAGSSS